LKILHTIALFQTIAKQCDILHAFANLSNLSNQTQNPAV